MKVFKTRNVGFLTGLAEVVRILGKLQGTEEMTTLMTYFKESF